METTQLQVTEIREVFSVPIRGLFNLTNFTTDVVIGDFKQFSVPIRGLFNLTI